MASNTKYHWLSTLFEITDFTLKFLTFIDLKGGQDTGITQIILKKNFKNSRKSNNFKMFQNNYNPFEIAANSLV